jgi:hypothetical protein
MTFRYQCGGTCRVNQVVQPPGRSSVWDFFQRFHRPPDSRTHFVLAIGALL